MRFKHFLFPITLLPILSYLRIIHGFRDSVWVRKMHGCCQTDKFRATFDSHSSDTRLFHCVDADKSQTKDVLALHIPIQIV